jgi:hypothetical protein
MPSGLPLTRERNPFRGARPRDVNGSLRSTREEEFRVDRYSADEEFPATEIL